MSFYRIFSKIYERAAKKMCLDCTDFIEKGSKMLDLGCGSGIVGKEFQDFFQAEMIGVDIQDTRVVNLPFKIIDGENLPFNDNEFDIALINYVLHHARNPKRLIETYQKVFLLSFFAKFI